MRHLYCWHQPNSAEFLKLSAKVEDLETRIEDHFTFEDVILNGDETLEEVITNPETNKIYIVKNGNEKDNDTYNEYVYRIKDGEKEGSFELIGSGSFAQFQAHVNEFTNHKKKTLSRPYDDKDIYHITSDDKIKWDTCVTDFKSHNGNLTKHVSNDDRTKWNNKQDKLTIDDVPKQGSTNPISSGGIWKFFPIGEEHDNLTLSFALGYQSHVCKDYSTAIGVGAVTRNKGEIVISGGTENGSVVSNVELILGTGDVQGYTKPIFNTEKGDNYWVNDEPYLEVRVSDNSNSPHEETCKRESVKISIRKLFDLLCANGGVYKNEGFGEDNTDED